MFVAASQRTSSGAGQTMAVPSADQPGIQASSKAVATGIRATSEIIGQLDVVQVQMGEVLEERARMASALD